MMYIIQSIFYAFLFHYHALCCFLMIAHDNKKARYAAGLLVF